MLSIVTEKQHCQGKEAMITFPKSLPSVYLVAYWFGLLVDHHGPECKVRFGAYTLCLGLKFLRILKAVLLSQTHYESSVSTVCGILSLSSYHE